MQGKMEKKNQTPPAFNFGYSSYDLLLLEFYFEDKVEKEGYFH